MIKTSVQRPRIQACKFAESRQYKLIFGKSKTWQFNSLPSFPLKNNAWMNVAGNRKSICIIFRFVYKGKWLNL